MSDEEELLKYKTFRSQVDPSFWQKISELKLEVDKLNENTRHIWGYYSNKKPEGQNQLFSVDASSFNKSPDENRIFAHGFIINKNTIEGFKDENKAELLKNEGRKMANIIKSEAVEDPSLLCSFLIFSFANLKSYQYYYWFIFPAPTFFSCYKLDIPKGIAEVLSKKQMDMLCYNYNLLDCHNKGFFFVRLSGEDLELFTIKEAIKIICSEKNWFLCFSDTSDTMYPSWPIRNFIAFVSYHCPNLMKSLNIICLRLDFNDGKWKSVKSIVLKVKVKLEENGWAKCESGEGWTGWERNEKNKMAPQLANLKHCMAPLNLAEASVDLNLKLMKWQILPELNLDIIKNSKCLLIGAGTLGCVIARNLMSWGVRHITFIDYGNISYSNPVRQNLYKFKDIGKSKAETAAAALREIFPGMVSSGFVFSVPMPGHPIGESLLDETRKNVEKLKELINQHDVIFLLMDSRESRWLPTLMAAANNKLVINAALGFDSYLVMRHGLKNNGSEIQIKDLNSKLLMGSKLGCYFCNDVTAPGNSFRGRTLDQQCTVTRPGVANMAGALAVELFVSIIQHPLGGLAPAEVDTELIKSSSSLGIIPHSIRGFISNYQTMLPVVEAFSSCVACSQKVIEKYKKEEFDFILKSLESKEYLEELCGLAELQNEPLLTEVLEYSGSESEESLELESRTS